MGGRGGLSMRESVGGRGVLDAGIDGGAGWGRGFRCGDRWGEVGHGGGNS